MIGQGVTIQCIPMQGGVGRWQTEFRGVSMLPVVTNMMVFFYLEFFEINEMKGE